MEILVADGGSTDETVDIAKWYGARVFNNPRRFADYGAKINVAEATGDLLVIFAADNELEGSDWLTRVAHQFMKGADISAVWGKLIAADHDPPINKYYELIQSDPFHYFLNKTLSFYLAQATFDPIHLL